MLGVTEVPYPTPLDHVFKSVAEDMGVGHTFKLTPVGVYFGEGPGVTEARPVLRRRGPGAQRLPAVRLCMTGCRHNAKNTMPKNYLGLAEAAGATVHPLTTVLSSARGRRAATAVETMRTGPIGKRRTFTADQVVVAAGTYNTQKLLHRMKDAGFLPRMSDRLGVMSRTNCESIVGAVARRKDADFTHGVAITSSFFPDERTHVEPVRYGKGSNLMGMLGTILTDGKDGTPRWKVWVHDMAASPRDAVRSLSVRRWSEKGAIALVMQSVDNSITVSTIKTRLGRRKLTSRQGDGEPNPTWIPAANDAARRIAEKIDGFPMGQLGDLLDAPMTAHFVGGACIGADPEHGVIDGYHRVFGHEGLHVVDGAAISANLGVNPSLTITAQAERAMALWPNKGDADQRPPLGSEYMPVPAVSPRAPVVPAHAPAALRLPIVDIRHADRAIPTD